MEIQKAGLACRNEDTKKGTGTSFVCPATSGGLSTAISRGWTVLWTVAYAESWATRRPAVGKSEMVQCRDTAHQPMYFPNASTSQGFKLEQSTAAKTAHVFRLRTGAAILKLSQACIVDVVMAITNVLGLRPSQWPPGQGCRPPVDKLRAEGRGLTPRMLQCPIDARALLAMGAAALDLISSSLLQSTASPNSDNANWREYAHAHWRQRQAACTPYPSRTVGGNTAPQLWPRFFSP
ncbi:hypothetical protein B0J13DRAFT_522140 [Dactylonectria estremocensis]|uniref:Uncharacterized protein n=1 Tax=Dactylonectria estremocensis TaxID=1079267 RepID=A0A9P9JC70_9HYPO|nr:hypothetical protein B0J13DRAFT_522140 [Dactylonectria estremocensis]